MVHLTTTVDGEPWISYRADGVLVATATGSTGYNLSAGGPVLAPTMRSMVVTPVAPHLSIDRSLVLEPESTVTIQVEATRPAVLVVDGRAVGRLSPGSAVGCRVAPRPLRLVSLGHRGFAGLLVEALAPTLDP
jgi:NAD+ kinase